MPLYQKPNKRSVHDVQLMRVIAENGIKPVEVMWACKGRCYVPGHPEDSQSKHLSFTFPSGTIWYVCTKCGAGVIFKDMDERNIALMPPELQEQATKDYKAFTRKIRREHEKQRVDNGRKKRK